MRDVLELIKNYDLIVLFAIDYDFNVIFLVEVLHRVSNFLDQISESI